MSGVVKIDITESQEVLKTLLAAQKTAFAQERVQALYERLWDYIKSFLGW